MKKIAYTLILCASPFVVSHAQVQDDSKRPENANKPQVHQTHEHKDYRDTFNSHNPQKGGQEKEKVKGDRMQSGDKKMEHADSTHRKIMTDKVNKSDKSAKKAEKQKARETRKAAKKTSRSEVKKQDD